MTMNLTTTNDNNIDTRRDDVTKEKPSSCGRTTVVGEETLTLDSFNSGDGNRFFSTHVPIITSHDQTYSSAAAATTQLRARDSHQPKKGASCSVL